MKKIILAWFFAVTAVNSAITADGKGFFPVMVQVVNAESGTPIKGAKVRIEGAGDYKVAELDPKRQTKILPESLGKTVEINTEGLAVVFYYGGWSDTTVDGKKTYTRKLLGTVIVEHEGKEIYRKSLEEWAKENEFKADAKSVPWILIPLAKVK